MFLTSYSKQVRKKPRPKAFHQYPLAGYQCAWICARAGIHTKDEAALSIGVSPEAYLSWTAGHNPAPLNLVENLAYNNSIDLASIPVRVAGTGVFPKHPHPKALDLGVMNLLAFAEHNMIELDKISAYDFLQMADVATKPKEN